MDQVGQVWAGLLETITSGKFEDALNEFMRLSNAVSRLPEDTERTVAHELEREGETRLTKAIGAEIQRISKQSVTRARNGDLSGSADDLTECLRLLRVRIGVDLVSKSGSSKSTTSECRVPIKQMAVVHLTVQCARKRDELRARLDLKKKTKNVVTSAEDGFLDAIEACAAYTVGFCKMIAESEVILADDSDADFYPQFVKSLNEAAASQVRQMMQWFQEDRRIQTYWNRRADELGGLTLPRALNNHADAPVKPSPSPPLPSSSSTSSSAGSKPPSRTATPGGGMEIKPLDDSESSALDLLLHESSQILSLCDEFHPKGLLEDVALTLVSAMVKLDELWLTHNITKAVTHAISLEIEPPIWVNSIAEDTFHVVGTCFARAVNSHSLFASEATANHVAGFIADGYVEILKELVRKDSPLTNSTSGATSNKASKAVAHIDLDQNTRRAFSSTSQLSPLFIESINTLASSRSYTENLHDEMVAAFEMSFNHPHAMAPALLQEAMEKMDSLLEESIAILCRCLLSPRAMRVMAEALDPRATPYELNVSSFERENVTKQSWVKDFVEAQFRQNSTLRECLPTLSHGPASQCVQVLTRTICDSFEDKLNRLRFSALGALQFDKDVRALCDTIVVECNNALAGFEYPGTSAAGTSNPVAPHHAGATVDDETRNLDTEVRSQFKRLRHWTFLLNLERAADQKEIVFPAQALSDDEINGVLRRRMEKDFFQS